MKRRVSAMAYLVGVLVFLGTATSAEAQVRVLDFEGLGDLEGVAEFYNGGLGDAGSGPGPDWGISFENSLAVKSIETGFSGNFTNAPSGNTILFFLGVDALTMNVWDGFSDGFSFFYSSIAEAGSVHVYDGLHGTGNLLASLDLAPLGGCAHPTAYCNWAPVGVTFEGTARSVDFGGVANFIGFDDITIGSERPGGPRPVPEPLSLALLATGLVGIAGVRRHRRDDRLT